MLGHIFNTSRTLSSRSHLLINIKTFNRRVHCTKSKLINPSLPHPHPQHQWIGKYYQRIYVRCMTNWERVTPKHFFILEINHLHQGTEKKWWKAIPEYFPASRWVWGGGYTFHFHPPFVFYILTKPEVLLTRNWEYAKKCGFE